MVLEHLADLDTYFYAVGFLILWNFLWTMRLRHKVFGSGSDPTEEGLAKKVEKLEKDE